MQISPGTQLVWSLSGSEAVNLGMPKIEPDHLFCGLLKFSELNDDTISGLLNDKSDLSSVIEERDDLALALEDLGQSTADIRHAVRKEAEHGTHKLEGNLIHRSDTSRKLFEAAIEKANINNEPVLPTHLLSVILADPTPAMKKVLKTDDGIPDWLLEKQGGEKQEEAVERLASWLRPIQELVPKKGFSVKDVCQPQLIVLTKALTDPVTYPLLLIYEEQVDVTALLGKTAVDQGDLPLFKVDQNKMQISVADLPEPEIANRVILSAIEETLQNESNWLFIDFTDLDFSGDGLWEDLNPLVQKQAHLIFAVSEKTYQQKIKADQAAETGFRIIWLHDLSFNHSINQI